MKRFPVALVVLSLASVALATDTAFWKPYRADGNTYALLTFDEPQPLSAQGKVDGQGSLAGGAELVEDGRFGGGLRLDGTGYAAFSTTIFDPGAMAIHPSNHSFSIEAWIKLDRYAENKEKALVVHRPANNGRSLGFSLFVMHDGALGLSVTRVGGSEHTFISDTGTVPVGKWVHIAGISCGGHLSVERDTLYVNGREVFSGSASGAAGGTADKAPADIHVGGSPEGGTLTGRIDEVRVHGRVGKLWPLDPMPWIKRVAEDGLPPLDKVLAPERQPWLMFHFDEQTRPVASSEIMARDPAIVERFKVSFDGKYIPGIRDRGINGELTIDGFRLADWTEGSLECWFRPRGVNNISDRNVVMLNASGLSVYFFNSVRASRGMAFYYRDGEGNLRMHRSGVEIHPGRWFHMTLTWDAETIAMYVNGKRATVGKNGKRGTLNNLSLHRAFEFDELCFYERRLTADEVANRHWSYVDPNRVAPVEWPAPILLGAWRFPSENVILYRLSAMPGYEKLHKATLSLTNADGEEILALDADLDGTMHRLDTPRLAEGFYVLRASVELDGEQLQSAPVAFLAADFAWENNRLGVTDEVFPPFEPVRTDGDTASVVLRDYRMNGFGLWDSVVSQGRELLNGPVRLHYRTVEGAEGTWIFENGSFVATAPHRAEYRARATSPAVNVDTVSEIEMDGMMKVTLRLSPGAERHKIEHLWLDVPLKASEATLMHEDVGTLRQNYSGFVPDGDGTVWRARCKDTRGGNWRNPFAGYVWIGGEERGIAWFAENDKGWITEKNLSDKPLQEIVRDGDTVAIRVNLINTPAVIEQDREIVFGLQASPAKPMPDDWRTGARGGGLPVNPWGGHQCADKFPFEDRWEIVDKIIGQQLTGKDNTEWFRQYRQKHDIPPLRGVTDWLKSVRHFASWNYRPVLVYFEEMAAPTYRYDWRVYKDEWSPGLRSPSREIPDGCQGPRETWPDVYERFRQGRRAGGAARVNFVRSYRDYAIHYANEWLKRGVGIYWDNTYLTTSTNPHTSAAYRTEDGHIQPALMLWNQREYSRRTWNLMQHWRRERGEKLLFLQHMTNTNLLPILAWATTSFDNEWRSGGEPFPPDYLRAQSTGRQTGNYPALCHGLFRFEHFNIPMAAVPRNEMDTPNHPQDSVYAAKREWGMSRVHEIPARHVWRAGSSVLEHALRHFGYGKPDVNVHNYWAESPALEIDDDNVKWLLLARPEDKRLFLVLQSWSRNPGAINVSLDFDVIGFRTAESIVNLETGAPIASNTGTFKLEMNSPYALKIVGVGPPPLPEGTLFADDFSGGISLHWTGYNSVGIVKSTHGANTLRIGKNNARWRGPVRIEKWQGVAGWEDAAIELNFRMSTIPDGKKSLMTVIIRAPTPQWSKHGLSHTRLNTRSGPFMELRADPANGQWEMVRPSWNDDGKRESNVHVRFGNLDDQPHSLTIAMDGPSTTIQFDGVDVETFGNTPQNGAAFGIHGSTELSNDLYIELDTITVREPREARHK